MVAGKITIVQMLPDLESGGVERGTLELGKYLSAGGHRSIVISAGGRMVPQLEQEGSRHIRWETGRKSPRCLQFILPLRRLLVEEKVDILHLRSRLPAWIGYLAWKSLPAHQRPCLVTTFHGFYSVNAYSAVMTKGQRIIAISKTIGGHIEAAYQVAPERITVDSTAFRPEAVAEDRLEKLRSDWQVQGLKGPLIMLPARLTRLKGHAFFIDSLALIRHLPWTAVCVGDIDPASSYPPELKKRVSELRLADRILFTGHCSDMPAAFMLADMVVSASTKPEAFGRTLIEAQAMGKPVIATGHGGSLEVVRDGQTGWLVDPGNVSRFAAALGRAIENKDLREAFGSSGRRWVAKMFKTHRMCEKTVALYGELIAGRDADGPR